MTLSPMDAAVALGAAFSCCAEAFLLYILELLIVSKNICSGKCFLQCLSYVVYNKPEFFNLCDTGTYTIFACIQRKMELPAHQRQFF